MNTRQVLITSTLLTNSQDIYECGLAFQFKLFHECVSQTGIVGEEKAKFLAQEIAPFQKLNARTFVKKGMPFFWKNICCGMDDLIYNHRDLDILIRQLLVTAFDAYFEDLPIGTSISLPLVEGMKTVLPYLGIQFMDSDPILSLHRLTKNKVRAESQSRWNVIDIDEPGDPFQLPKLPILGSNSIVLLANDPTLFRERDIRVIELDSKKAENLTAMISRALDLIELVEPDLRQAIDMEIKWYVPLYTPDPKLIHHSFTVLALDGVIFLSEAVSDLALAEAIIHEFSHLELNRLMEAHPVLKEQVEEKFYSPWRDDVRPLYGLFHALYVFSVVVSFLETAEQTFEQEYDRECCRSRRLELCYQLELGLAQVEFDSVLEIGRDILESIKSELEQQDKDLGFSERALPGWAKEHVENWCQSHPEMIDRIKIPRKDDYLKIRQTVVGRI